MRQVPLLLALALSGFRASPPLPPGQDIDKILERADKLLEEAKAAYETARDKSSVQSFIEAGFKLEEARIKYLVLQEIGSSENQRVAADRLRAVNQLSKLIHDGKVAITGSAAESQPAKSSDPPPAPTSKDPAPNPALPPPALPVDPTKRAPVPDAAKQRESEKLIKDLFKELYAKNDRKGLLRALLEQATKSQEDPPALWVLYRESTDLAVQSCDVRTAIQIIDVVARVFDVDALSMKTAALQAAGKTAKEVEDFAFLAEALLYLVDDLVAADLYDPAEKTASLALFEAKKAMEPTVLARASTRLKEVAEAKTLYQSTKKNMEIIAKIPEDPGANFEMGKYLCFVKGSWDLGLRFLVRGSDTVLKGLAEKELGFPSSPAERLSLADGWWDLAEREKSSLRKTQMQAHCRVLYRAALADASSLVKAKIEKRLDQLREPGAGSPKDRPSRKVVITKAKFTSGGKLFDLTKVVQEAFDQNPYTPIRCDDYLVAGENTLGQAKSMLLEGTVDGQPLKESIKDGEVFVFPRIPPDGAPSAKASQRFAIVEAQFGVGVNWGDVTDIVRSKLTDPYTTIQDTITGVDPFPGKVKTLMVVFEFRGRRYLRWLSDGDSMSLLRK